METLSDKEILDWLDNCDEPFVEILRLYPAGKRVCGIKVCSRQTEEAIVKQNIREALSEVIRKDFS